MHRVLGILCILYCKTLLGHSAKIWALVDHASGVKIIPVQMATDDAINVISRKGNDEVKEDNDNKEGQGIYAAIQTWVKDVVDIMRNSIQKRPTKELVKKLIEDTSKFKDLYKNKPKKDLRTLLLKTISE